MIQNKVKVNYRSISGVNHRKNNSVLSEQNSYLMNVVQDLKNELSETRKQLMRVTDVSPDYLNINIKQSSKEKNSETEKYLKYQRLSQETVSGDFRTQKIEIFKDQIVCTSCGKTKTKGVDQKYRSDNKQKSVEPKSTRVVDHGSHMNFIKKLRK